MKKYLEILKKSPLFKNISEGDILNILGCLNARVDIYDKKYTIIAEGTPSNYVGLLLSGTAQIISIDYFGNRSILGELGQGELFAEAFACAEIESIPIDVIANEPCEVMLLDASHLLHTCHKNCLFHRQLIFNLMRNLALKNIMFHRRIEITSKRTTREKLMTYLIGEAKKAGQNSFTIPFDRQELADYLEVERSGLSAEISKLRAEGVLESKKNHFTLL